MAPCGWLEQLGFAVGAVRGDAGEGGNAKLVEDQAGPDFVIDRVRGSGREQGELAHGERHVLAALLDAILALQRFDDDAGGFLAGFSEGRTLGDCAVMGAVAAAEIISHIGARPEADLAVLVKKRLG